MTKHLVRFQTSMNSRLRGDSGQGALEYVGILIIIGVIVAAVVLVIGDAEDDITGAVGRAIEGFLSGDEG